MDILTQLQEETRAIDMEQVKLPDTELEDGQTVIGTASDHSVRLFGLRINLVQQIRDLARQHSEICPPLSADDHRRHDAIENEQEHLLRKTRAVESLLWLNIMGDCEGFDWSQAADIGLTKDRQIWYSERHEEQNPLSRLFGAGNIRIISLGGFGGRG